MTTSEELLNILNSADEENHKIEFKASDIFNSIFGKEKEQGTNKIAKVIVAFANREGGKIIIGIRNDKSFEEKGVFNEFGRNGKSGIDECKRIINQICHSRISPVIDCEIEFLSLDQGDVLIISVPQRTGIPHAIASDVTGSTAKTRIYYLRKSSGDCDLVSNEQLEWLFTRSQKQSLEYQFRTAFTYDENIKQVKDIAAQLRCVQSYSKIINHLSSKNIIYSNGLNLRNKIDTRVHFVETQASLERQRLEQRESFFLAITPYAMIIFLANYFSASWDINIQRSPSSQVVTGFDVGENIQTVDASEMPDPIIKCQEFLDKTALEAIREIPYAISLPEKTEIKIIYGNLFNIREAVLLFDNPSFQFRFIFSCRFIQEGLPYDHPLNSTNNSYRESCFSPSIDCFFKASFGFPEDFNLFTKYYRYSEVIIDLLENDWNFDHLIRNLPNELFYGMNEKLDEILRRIS